MAQQAALLGFDHSAEGDTVSGTELVRVENLADIGHTEGGLVEANVEQVELPSFDFAWHRRMLDIILGLPFGPRLQRALYMSSLAAQGFFFMSELYGFYDSWYQKNSDTTDYYSLLPLLAHLLKNCLQCYYCWVLYALITEASMNPTSIPLQDSRYPGKVSFMVAIFLIYRVFVYLHLLYVVHWHVTEGWVFQFAFAQKRLHTYKMLTTAWPGARAAFVLCHVFAEALYMMSGSLKYATLPRLMMLAEFEGLEKVRELTQMVRCPTYATSISFWIEMPNRYNKLGEDLQLLSASRPGVLINTLLAIFFLYCVYNVHAVLLSSDAHALIYTIFSSCCFVKLAHVVVAINSAIEDGPESLHRALLLSASLPPQESVAGENGCYAQQASALAAQRVQSTVLMMMVSGHKPLGWEIGSIVLRRKALFGVVGAAASPIIAAIKHYHSI